MTAWIDILEPRAIELTLIIVLGGIVAGLVTYIIRNLQGSFNMLSPAVQAQESRVSNLEGRMDREREELDIIFRAVDLKIEAISYRLDTNKQNNSEFNAEFKELRTGHYGLFTEVHSRFNHMQSDIHEAQSNFKNVSYQLNQMEAGLRQVEAGLQHTDANLKQMEAGLQQTDANLKQMEAGLQQTDANLKQMETGLQHTDANLKQVETGLQQMEAGLQNTDANMKQVETRLQQTESGLQLTISNIEKIGSDLENRFESLGAKVDAWSNETNQITEESQRDIGEIRAIIQSTRDHILSDE